MTIRLHTHLFTIYPKYQFVYPSPKGSELIVPASLRAGVNEENKFAD